MQRVSRGGKPPALKESVKIPPLRSANKSLKRRRMKMWEKDFSIQSEVSTLAFMGSVGFNRAWRQLLWAIGFPFAKTFGGVRTKPELLPTLPRRVVEWVYICITFVVDLPKPASDIEGCPDARLGFETKLHTNPSRTPIHNTPSHLQGRTCQMWTRPQQTPPLQELL